VHKPATRRRPHGFGYSNRQYPWFWLVSAQSRLDSRVSVGGTLFHIGFALSRALGLLPPSLDSTIRAVAYVAVLQLSVLPVQVFSSRRLLSRLFPFALTMSFTGIPMVFLGTFLLVTGDMALLKRVIGAIFLVFSAWRLVQSAKDWALRNQHAPCEPHAETRSSSTGESEDVSRRLADTVATGSWDTQTCIASNNHASNLHAPDVNLNAGPSHGTPILPLQPLPEQCGGAGTLPLKAHDSDDESRVATDQIAQSSLTPHNADPIKTGAITHAVTAAQRVHQTVLDLPVQCFSMKFFIQAISPLYSVKTTLIAMGCTGV